MLKDTGYQEKFEILSPWVQEIIESVKKDLKNDHLKIDREFCKRYFLGKNYQHVQVEEMVAAYQKDISTGNVGLGEFISSRWLLKNTDVYGFFEEKLKTLNPNFDEIEELSEKDSIALMQDAVRNFGPTRVYLFCVLNSVVFPPKIYDNLRQMAEKETLEKRNTQESQKASETLESLQKKYTRDMAALEDRYEKKISGLQRKYLNDVQALKKQIANLQKKLIESNKNG